jgi:hypothetical protein
MNTCEGRIKKRLTEVYPRTLTLEQLVGTVGYYDRKQITNGLSRLNGKDKLDKVLYLKGEYSLSEEPVVKKLYHRKCNSCRIEYTTEERFIRKCKVCTTSASKAGYFISGQMEAANYL